MFSLRAVFLVLAAGGLSVAAEPALHLYPAAGQRGTTLSVTASGKFDSWPPQVWVDAPGIAFKPSQKKGVFDVGIAKDAAAGPHLVRLFDAKSVSEPRFFIVSDEPEILEMEPNDDFRSPQKISNLPAIVSGRLDKSGDVDSYGVQLRQGQKITAWLEAYVLASTFDGMLRIVDEKGVQLAFNHDGRTLDPYLAWEAPRDGLFVVQIMGFAYPATADVRLTGGEGCVYRLHLTTGPGPGVPLIRDASQSDDVAQEKSSDSTGKARSVAIPAVISGCIQKAGGENRFAFDAVKQRTYELKLSAASFVSPLEAWLRIENKEGKSLARNNDGAGARSAHLTWTAPGDGSFIAAVGDVSHHGGSDYAYRLSIAEAAPSLTGTVESHSISVNAGKIGEIKVLVKRANGFQGKLKIAGKNLPEGVSAPEVEVAEKAGEGVLKLAVEPDAKPASQPIQIVLREIENGNETPVRYMMTTSSENNGVPGGYTELVIDSTDQFWLTVAADAAKPETTK